MASCNICIIFLCGKDYHFTCPVSFLINVSFCVIFVFSFLQLFRSYSLLSDAQLDERIKELIGQNEDLGAESVRARLRGSDRV